MSEYPKAWVDKDGSPWMRQPKTPTAVAEYGPFVESIVVPADAIVIEAGSEMHEAMAALERSTSSKGEVVARLRDAVDIAQAGGLASGDVLAVLLHLAAAQQMTPTVRRRLREVGIDPDPMDAIVIEREGLPKVAPALDDTDREVSAGNVRHVDLSVTTSTILRERALGYLALADYLDAHPPVDESAVEALAVDLFAARWPGLDWNRRADVQQGDYRMQARRLLATGRVHVDTTEVRRG